MNDNENIENINNNIEENIQNENKPITEQDNMNNKENDNISNEYSYEDFIEKSGEKSFNLRLLFEKYLFSFHAQISKYHPQPYDYLFMVLLGYLFMSLFIGGKKSIKIKKSKRLVNPDVFAIEQEISKIQEKMKKGDFSKNKQKINVDNLVKEKINFEKLESIEKGINYIMNDLNERNKENSKEKNLLNNICDIQTNILNELTQGSVKKKGKKEQNDDNEEEEEEEDDEEANQ